MIASCSWLWYWNILVGVRVSSRGTGVVREEGFRIERYCDRAGIGSVWKFITRCEVFLSKALIRGIEPM